MGGLTEKRRAEAIETFRAALDKAKGSRAARDLAAVLALLRRGCTASQVRAVWVVVVPAMKEAAAYVRMIIAKAQARLRRDRPRSSTDIGPRP